MKKTFTLEELIKNKGCYTEEQITELYSDYNREVTIIEVLKNKILDLDDKRWFLYRICELTTKQKIELSYTLGKAVAPIFNEKYPDDNCVNACWKVVRDFKNKVITKKQFLKKRNTMDDAFFDIDTPAGYAADSAYYTATAICYDIVGGNYLASWAVDAASCAAIAALSNKNPIYINLLNQLMIAFVNKN